MFFSLTEKSKQNIYIKKRSNKNLNRHSRMKIITNSISERMKFLIFEMIGIVKDITAEWFLRLTFISVQVELFQLKFDFYILLSGLISSGVKALLIFRFFSKCHKYDYECFLFVLFNFLSL